MVTYKSHELILLKTERDWIDWNTVTSTYIDECAVLARVWARDLKLAAEEQSMEITRCDGVFITDPLH